MPASMQQQLVGGIHQWIPPELRYISGTAVRDEQGRLVSPGTLRPTQAFDYNADFVGANVLPASGTVTINIQIQSDSDFLILDVARVVTDTPLQTTALAFMPATLLLTDTGSGRLLMDRPEHIENYFGSGQFVRVLGRPYFIRSASTFAVTLQNLDAVNARAIRLAFHGAKIF